MKTTYNYQKIIKKKSFTKYIIILKSLLIYWKIAFFFKHLIQYSNQSIFVNVFNSRKSVNYESFDILIIDIIFDK